MKIARVAGARPQFMQIPPLRDALLAHGHEHIFIHTGQHYDFNMSDSFFSELALPAPDRNLEVSSSKHGAATGRMIEKLEEALIEIRPDVVLIDGDTNTTLAAAIVAVKMRIPVCHIEAGLRDFDRRRPEEINRVLSDHASDLNCAPIPRALDNLRTEGLGSRSVLVGDALLDCFIRYLPQRVDAVWRERGLKPGTFHLMTLHRPENTDLTEFQRFSDIMKALKTLDKPIIFPVHPRTRPILDKYLHEKGSLGAIWTVPPVGYLDMLGLLHAADIVFTDSGGLPREAAWAGRRVVMLHRVDVWHDMLKHGWVQNASSDCISVLRAIEAVKEPDPSLTRAFFGGGNASARIAAAVTKIM